VRTDHIAAITDSEAMDEFAAGAGENFYSVVLADHVGVHMSDDASLHQPEDHAAIGRLKLRFLAIGDNESVLIDRADFQTALRGLEHAIEDRLRRAGAKLRIIFDLAGENEET